MSLYDPVYYTSNIIYTNTGVSTSTSANLLLHGGLTLLSTSDTTNLTSGGSVTMLGGMSINKSLLVG